MDPDLAAPGDLANSFGFAEAAHAVATAARSRGLVVPGFRSPPAGGADRTVRRRRGAPAAVAVRVSGRPLHAVVEDMVEGVVVANGLAGVDAEQCRLGIHADLALGREAA